MGPLGTVDELEECALEIVDSRSRRARRGDDPQDAVVRLPGLRYLLQEVDLAQHDDLPDAVEPAPKAVESAIDVRPLLESASSVEYVTKLGALEVGEELRARDPPPPPRPR